MVYKKNDRISFLKVILYVLSGDGWGSPNIFIVMLSVVHNSVTVAFHLVFIASADTFTVTLLLVLKCAIYLTRFATLLEVASVEMLLASL